MIPKKRRPLGRLPQLTKVRHLQARRLGQWVAVPQVAREPAVTRFALADGEWRKDTAFDGCTPKDWR